MKNLFILDNGINLFLIASKYHDYRNSITLLCTDFFFQGPVLSVAFSKKGEKFASGGADAQVCGIVSLIVVMFVMVGES